MVSYLLPSTKPSLSLKAHLFTPEIIYNVFDIQIKQTKIRVPQQAFVENPRLPGSSLDIGHNTEDHTALSQVRDTSKSV